MNHDENVNGGLEGGRVLTKGRHGLGLFLYWIWPFAAWLAATCLAAPWLAAPLSASAQHLRPIERPRVCVNQHWHR